MIRVVVEIPSTVGLGIVGRKVLSAVLGRDIRTERDAVRWVRSVLEGAGYPSLAQRVKSYGRVRAAERLKTVGEDDVLTRLRRLRNHLDDIIREHE